jgi:hypothetical protein
MADSTRARVAAWFIRKAKRFGWNLAAFGLIAAPLAAFAGVARNSILWLTLNAGAGLALSVAVVYVLAIVLLLPALARDHFKGKFGVLLGGLVGFAIGAPPLLAYVFAGVSFAMASLGWVNYVSTKAPEYMIVDLSESYMWHVYDLIPAIEVNRSLGENASRIVLETVWVNGAPDHKGLLLVAFRLIVALVLFRTILRVFERSRQEKGDGLAV